MMITVHLNSIHSVLLQHNTRILPVFIGITALVHCLHNFNKTYYN